MRNSNVVNLNEKKRIEIFIKKLPEGEFYRAILGFDPYNTSILADVKRLRKLCFANFEAFWGDIGGLVRSDFIKLYRDTVKKSD